MSTSQTRIAGSHIARGDPRPDPTAATADTTAAGTATTAGTAATAGSGPEDRGRWRALLRRWPTALGLGIAAIQILDHPDRSSGILVAVAATCYLAAAAFGRPWLGWPAIPACGVLMLLARQVGLDPLWALAGASALLVVIGIVTRVSRGLLTLELVGVSAYGGLVVAAVFVTPAVGLVLVGSALVAHGAWDAWHLWRRIVVPGSIAEFCLFLDVPLGIAILLGVAFG